jgi:hypothetical protein
MEGGNLSSMTNLRISGPERRTYILGLLFESFITKGYKPGSVNITIRGAETRCAVRTYAQPQFYFYFILIF